MLYRIGCVVGAMALVACSRQERVASPSVDQAPYAESYPQSLLALRTRTTDEEHWVRERLAPLKELPNKLEGAQFAQVRLLLTQADEEGRSGAYLDEVERTRAVQTFFKEEGQPLRQKVAGSVNYTAKEKQCSEDLGSVAAAAMERSVDKQLMERRHKQSVAQRYLDAHTDAFGRGNLQRLEDQADDVARMSFLVRLGLPADNQRLQALLEEESDVRDTLARTVQEADEALAEPKLSGERKRALQTARKRAQDANTRQASEVEATRAVTLEREKKLMQLERDYETTLDAVLDDLEARAKKQKTP